MFDIGFSELLLVGLVALLVLGPERLPAAARVTGLWLGRIKRSFNTIKTDVERELGADEIRQQLRNEEVLAKERKLLAETAQQTKNALEQGSSLLQNTLNTKVELTAEKPVKTENTVVQEQEIHEPKS